MHDDPPMIAELQARFYPAFERRWRFVEIVGRFLMLAVVVATLGGYLGGGPVHIWTRRIEAHGLSVTYQPVARFGTPSGLDITVPVSAHGGEVGLTFPDALATRFDLQTTLPHPVRWEPGEAAMRLVFRPAPGAEAMRIHVGGMPPEAGWLSLSVQLDGRDPLSWRQFILP